mmetsp:Transcript_91881/g.163567  ORF Transcript_91881/g.163567 Transcript_91881/m.163567 type:complete len:177 (+) Transcript_91881:96-626(+)|eukprot:CAMPEP_0197650530 /NCGR_PEP_ID=MMETSP1338-20131121/31005_1 /TAXON_ID=43686 ORGANISM="Pelagodinium beii, Strain RCC1491" /NCGR_SAMPLE_ID=MMETSP1338 /ASSEMBLY_ACC=CAM_ASM_000754 /LENGTH=176 /DNA_ID=CAMNT_0043224959 /DNA_START=96 /DNA_END=626 /DNA_ORIENTATION=-
MARVGVANYALSTDDPVKQDKYWREGLERNQRDHAYSVFNEQFPKASYAYINTTSNDFMGRTWQVLHHTKSVAAGKCSFHHNVAKPAGSTVRAHASSSSFERLPPASNRSAQAAAQGMLQNSMSSPTLSRQGYTPGYNATRPMEDDMRSGRFSMQSGRSGRSQRSQRSQRIQEAAG